MQNLPAKKQYEILLESKKNLAAFSPLYDFLYPKIYRYCMRRTGDVRTSEDITAEVFSKVVKNLDSFTWQGHPVSSWVYRIAGNLITDFYRGKKHTTTSLNLLQQQHGFDLASTENIEQEIDHLQQRFDQKKKLIIIMQKISELSPHEQEIITLHIFEEKTFREISDITETSTNTIKSKYRRAISKLQKTMHPTKLNSVVNDRVKKYE